MMDNMPLRGLRSFGAFPEGALERMIADLNAEDGAIKRAGAATGTLCARRGH